MQIDNGIDVHILIIADFSSSKFVGGNIFNNSFIMDHTISMAERSGEFWGHLGITSPSIVGPLSQVAMKLLPNKLNSIRNSKGNSVLFNKDDFCKLHEDIEFIFIPHAIKDKGLLDHELEKSTIDWVIKALISGLGFPILFENTNV